MQIQRTFSWAALNIFSYGRTAKRCRRALRNLAQVRDGAKIRSDL